MWYFLKNRNDKIYTNRNGNAQELLCKTEVEGALWVEAHTMVVGQHGQLQQNHVGNYSDHTRVCLIDGLWKEVDIYTGQRLFCRKESSTEDMMGAMNIRHSLSPLHVECEILISAMEYMKFLQFSDVVFETVCSQLVKMVVSTPEE